MPKPGHLKPRADLDEVESTEAVSVSSLSFSCSLLVCEWPGSELPLWTDDESRALGSVMVTSWRGGAGRAGSSGGGGETVGSAGVDDPDNSSTSGFTSTSSASRYHFRRLVQRPQPSAPRRPLFH